MDDELARARRALRAVDAELSLTWDEVLDRAGPGDDRDDGFDRDDPRGGPAVLGAPETAPVLPLRPQASPHRRAGRVAAAASVVVLAVGAGLLAADRRPVDDLPPGASQTASGQLGSSSATTPAGPAEEDAARPLVDRARQALVEASPCAALLTSREPRRVVVITDATLTPARVLFDGTWAGSTPDGRPVGGDDDTGTWWATTGEEDLLAGEPAAAAAVGALRGLAADDGDGAWSLVDEDGAAGASNVVARGDGVSRVEIALDPKTWLPVQVLALAPGGTALDVEWLGCDDAKAKDVLSVTVPDGYRQVDGRPADPASGRRARPRRRPA